MAEQKKSINIMQAFAYGADQITKYPGFFLSLSALFFLMRLIPVLLVASNIISKSDVPQLNFLISLCSIYFSFLLLKGALFVLDGKKPTFAGVAKDINLSTIITLLIAMVLMGAGFLVGLLFFIIPGIYLMLLWFFVTVLILDKKATLGEIFNAGTSGGVFALSAQLSKGVKLSLLAFLFFNMVINFVGGLLFGIGAIFTIPLTSIANVWVYRKLLEQTQEK
jgi:hypothetical protein